MSFRSELLSASAVSRGTAAELWVIEPRRAGPVAIAREVWRYRHLLRYFGGQALQKIYKRTILGWLWLFLRPLVPVLLGTLVFGGLLSVPSDNVPYFLFYLTGLASWNLFEGSLIWVTRSLELNRRLITKLYFPRLILPLSAVTPAVVECFVYFFLIVAAIVYYRWTVGRMYLVIAPTLLLSLVAAVLSIACAVAFGLWTSVLEAQARDVKFTLRYVVRFWFYFTPVIYPLSHIPERWRWVATLNPMAPLIELFKWSLLGIGEPTLHGFVTATVTIAVIGVAGLWFFTRAEGGSIDNL